MDKLAMIKKAEVHGVLAALIDSEFVKIADEQVFSAIVDTISGSLSENYDLNEVLEKTAGVLEAAEELLAAKENLEAAIMEEGVADVAEADMLEEAPELEEDPELEEVEEAPELDEEDIDLSDLSEEELAALEELSKEAQENGGDMVKTAMIRHHELILKKEAGQIDDEEFIKQAVYLRAGLGALRNVAGAAKDRAGSYLGNLKRNLAAPFDPKSRMRVVGDRAKGQLSTGGEIDPETLRNLQRSMVDPAKAYGTVGAAGAAGLYGLNKLRD